MAPIHVDSQMPNLFIYTVGYVLFAVGLIYPPTEFISAGITIPELFSLILGNEADKFVQYHIKRSIVTLLIHSLLPTGYVVGLHWLGHLDAVQGFLGNGYSLLLTLSLFFLVGPIYAFIKCLRWSHDNFANHPIAKSLAAHCNDQHRTWLDVAAHVNSEFKTYMRHQIAINSTSKVVATYSWIMKVSTHKLEIANQRNSTIITYAVNTYESSSARGSPVHYVKYMVVSGQPVAENFRFKIKNTDTRALFEIVRMPSWTLSSVVIPKTVKEVRILAIKKEAEKNARFFVSQQPDSCVICLEKPANVKIYKNCHNEPHFVEGFEDFIPEDPPDCRQCYCPPIFCINCLAEWFIMRRTHDNDDLIEYVQQKSTCPQCRAVFCPRDIRLISGVEEVFQSS